MFECEDEKELINIQRTPNGIIKVFRNNACTNYYLDDRLHRLDGPAIEWSDNSKVWYQKGVIHRIDGPAIEWPSGHKEWLIRGLRHRLDGPAVEYVNGYKEWYFEGKLIDCKNQEEFERLLKLKAFW